MENQSQQSEILKNLLEQITEIYLKAAAAKHLYPDKSEPFQFLMVHLWDIIFNLTSEEQRKPIYLKISEFQDSFKE